MKGNYLLEIHQRHNVGHFTLKFAHDIDLHYPLNPLYVLGRGGRGLASWHTYLRLTQRGDIHEFFDFFTFVEFFAFWPPPPGWEASYSTIYLYSLICRTLSLATLISQHRILRLYLSNTAVRSVSCDFKYLTLCFYVMWGLTREIITRWRGSLRKNWCGGGESPQMSLLSFLSCIATRLLETWSHGKGIPLETETLNLHS